MILLTFLVMRAKLHLCGNKSKVYFKTINGKKLILLTCVKKINKVIKITQLCSNFFVVSNTTNEE